MIKSPRAAELLKCVVSEAVSHTRYIITRMMFRSAARTQVGSIEVADLIGNDNSEVMFDRLRAACALIETYDARRFLRLQKDVARIVFLESGPEFWHRGRICVLHDIGSLEEAQVAAILVHEGTHARLYTRRIGYTSHNRKRIEHLCIREELSFLARLPGSQHLIQRTRQKLDEPWWTPEALRERHLDSLTAAGAPAILTRVYRKLSRRHKSAQPNERDS